MPLDLGSGQINELMLGMAPGANAGTDSLDIESPSPSETGQRAVLVKDERELTRDIRGDGEDAIWELWITAADQDVMVTWNQEHVPPSGLFITPIDSRGAGGDPSLTRDMAQENHIVAPAGGNVGYRIRHAIFEYDLHLRSGWQLIGLPFEPTDPDVTFGGLLTETLAFRDDYRNASALAAHEGYFAFAPGPSTALRREGEFVMLDGGTLRPGWNLISVALPPGRPEITLEEFLIIYPQATGVAWHLDCAVYRSTLIFKAGVGYWVSVAPSKSP